MSFADAYGSRKRVRLRPQTPASSKYGGHTGHFAGANRGVHAAAPHRGHHTGPNRYGPHAATPHDGGHARQGAQQDSYAAAGPQQGFVTGARGDFQPQAPGMC